MCSSLQKSSNYQLSFHLNASIKENCDPITIPSITKEKELDLQLRQTKAQLASTIMKIIKLTKEQNNFIKIFTEMSSDSGQQAALREVELIQGQRKTLSAQKKELWQNILQLNAHLKKQ